jgi:polyhydroxyalkanoate synthesis regulator phasin
LDLVAEKISGPKGYFKTHDYDDIVKSGKEKFTDFENTVKQRLNQAIRGKRSVTKEALEEVRQKVSLKRQFPCVFSWV